MVNQMPKNKKRGPCKPHGMNLAQAKTAEKQARDDAIRAEAWTLFMVYRDNLLQQCMDAAFMAAADVFHMGTGRCVEFGNTALQYLQEIAQLVNVDFEDDKDLVYAREKIDRRLKQICGENFEPWEVRYGKVGKL